MIKKHKMARLLPNGLAITTNTNQKVSGSLEHTPWSDSPAQPQEPPRLTRAHSYVLPHLLLFFFSMSQYIFVSLLSRDSVYDMLRTVCTHLQVWSSSRS